MKFLPLVLVSLNMKREIFYIQKEVENHLASWQIKERAKIRPLFAEKTDEMSHIPLTERHKHLRPRRTAAQR